MPFCMDFGPVNLGVVMQFCDFMEKKLSKPLLADRHLVYSSCMDWKSTSNACFLLAAYLVVSLKWTPEDAVRPFSGTVERLTKPFRDATFEPSDFDLTLANCIHGLAKAVEKQLFAPDSFNTEEYFKWDSPHNGDLHRITPKLVAFKSPAGEADRWEEKKSKLNIPTHSATYYATVFKELGVSAVVRLTEADSYDGAPFEAAGIAVHDLFFADCTSPPIELLERFIAIVDAAEGAVAVHCLAGLGRTGTLIAGWLIRRCGFTAREAIGWVRVVRPGSVIGPQQSFLAALELGSEQCWRLPSSGAACMAVSAALSMELAEHVKTGVLRKLERCGGGQPAVDPRPSADAKKLLEKEEGC